MGFVTPPDLRPHVDLDEVFRQNGVVPGTLHKDQVGLYNR